jgi:glycosyltransferase involved in cell wall biosynthesis
MKAIKVYLQYPWKFPDSPYYKYLIQNPPEGADYLNIENQKGVIINKKKRFFLNSIKKKIRRVMGLVNFPAPNVHFTKSKNKFDLIHCAHCLSGNKSAWVADFEGIWQMFISGKETFFGKKLASRILKSTYCKKMIAWTEATKKDFSRTFPGLEEKIEVVYPAVPAHSRKENRKKEVVLLFIGRYFYEKGGHHALEIMDKLTAKYNNVKGIVVSEVPNKVREKYRNNKKIEFYKLMSQSELFSKIYPLADIFLYPGYSDTFGFAILEAMSFGLPIVTADAVARKELVENGKTGFVIEANHKREWETDYVKIDDENRIFAELLDKTEELIANRAVREKMSKKCTELIKSGKFSLAERNKNLRRIYEEALE